MLIFNRATSEGPPPHGREGVFFGVNGEHRLYDLCKVRTSSPCLCSVSTLIHGRTQTVGDALVSVGLAKDKNAVPTPLNDAEIAEFFGPPPAGLRKAVRLFSSCALGYHDES
jgi:hypothetical protein